MKQPSPYATFVVTCLLIIVVGSLQLASAAPENYNDEYNSEPRYRYAPAKQVEENETENVESSYREIAFDDDEDSLIEEEKEILKAIHGNSEVSTGNLRTFNSAQDLESFDIDDIEEASFIEDKVDYFDDEPTYRELAQRQNSRGKNRNSRGANRTTLDSEREEILDYFENNRKDSSADDEAGDMENEKPQSITQRKDFNSWYNKRVYLRDDMPLAQVNVKEAYLLSAPGEYNSILSIAPYGASVAIEKRLKDWYRVIGAEGARGWIHSSVVVFDAGLGTNRFSTVRVKGYDPTL